MPDDTTTAEVDTAREQAITAAMRDADPGWRAMTPEAAAWVYGQVLTGLVLSSLSSGAGPEQLRACDCSAGMCWHCVVGGHSSCASRGPGGGVVIDAFRPETHLLSRTGAYRARVWRSGRPCRWVCPCDCPTFEPAGQLELFAVAAR